MFGSLLILLAMPWLDTSRVRSNAFRPFMKIFFWIFVANFFLLFWVGGKHVEEPFITIGLFSTILYFGYFVVIVPMIGIFENTLIDTSLPTKKL